MSRIDDFERNQQCVPLGQSNYEINRMQVGNLLLTSNELIQNILKNLNYHDLLTAIQVCKAWSFIGHSILSKERRLRFTTIHPNDVPTTDPDITSLDILNLSRPPFEVLESFLTEASEKTFHCIGFTCGGWLHRNDIVTSFSPKGASLSGLLSAALPNHCELALVSASGVIGSVEKLRHQHVEAKSSPETSNQVKGADMSLDQPKQSETPIDDDLRQRNIPQSIKSFNSVGYSIELEEVSYRPGPLEDMEALNLLLLPQQPGVKIKIFNLDEKEFLKTYRPNTAGHEKRIEITLTEFNDVCGLTPDDDLKAFLIFTHTYRSLTRSLIEAARIRQDDNVAIGGGLVELTQQKGESFIGTVAIAMSGKNLQTASIVVPSSVKDEKTLKVYLQRLKDRDLPEEHSMCFLFSCCGRGSTWYGRNKVVVGDEFCNVETKAFRNLFPQTPIFGFFGDGEIGNNFFLSPEATSADDETGGSRKRKKRKQNFFHQYSSVYVFISFM